MFREGLEDSQRRFISLDALMQYIPVYVLYELAEHFAASEAECRQGVEQFGSEAGKTPIDAASREKWIETFKRAKASELIAKMLPFAMATIDRLIEALQKPDTTAWSIGELLRDLNRRIVDELKTQLHYQVDPNLQHFVYKPLGGWEEAIVKFPPIKNDAEQASMCLVFYRWTASVFHSMRVLECGLDKLCKMTRVAKKRPGWDGLIASIDQKHLAPKPGTKKTAAKRKKDRFIADAVMLLRAVKEARNTTMHDYTKSYNGTQAVEIYNAVRSFMQKMAEVA